MEAKQVQELIRRRPFRALQITVSNGDRFAVLEERDIFNNPRRPELYVVFTEDGLAHWIEAEDIVAISSL